MTTNRKPISTIEDKLRRFLKPVHPDPEFIHQLRSRLVTTPSVVIEHRSKGMAFVIFGLSLFIGVFMVWFIKQLRK